MLLLLLGRITALAKQPVAADGVAWSVCLFVSHDREPCKNSWTDRGSVWDVNTWVDPRNRVLHGGTDPRK